MEQVGSGIGDIFPGSIIDDFLFDPCGYSMNGLMDGGFYTIHITPEAECSYVSFETNIPCGDYEEVVKKVLTIFQPKVSVPRCELYLALLSQFLPSLRYVFCSC